MQQGGFIGTRRAYKPLTSAGRGSSAALSATVEERSIPSGILSDVTLLVPVPAGHPEEGKTQTIQAVAPPSAGPTSVVACGYLMVMGRKQER